MTKTQSLAAGGENTANSKWKGKLMMDYWVDLLINHPLKFPVACSTATCEASWGDANFSLFDNQSLWHRVNFVCYCYGNNTTCAVETVDTVWVCWSSCWLITAVTVLEVGGQTSWGALRFCWTHAHMCKTFPSCCSAMHHGHNILVLIPSCLCVAYKISPSLLCSAVQLSERS